MSFLEIVIALSIVSLVVCGLHGMLVPGHKAYARITKDVDALARSTAVMERMFREFRRSAGFWSPTPNTIEYDLISKTGFERVKIEFRSQAGQGGSVLRTAGGQEYLGQGLPIRSLVFDTGSVRPSKIVTIKAVLDMSVPDRPIETLLVQTQVAARNHAMTPLRYESEEVN